MYLSASAFVEQDPDVLEGSLTGSVASAGEPVTDGRRGVAVKRRVELMGKNEPDPLMARAEVGQAGGARRQGAIVLLGVGQLAPVERLQDVRAGRAGPAAREPVGVVLVAKLR